MASVLRIRKECVWGGKLDGKIFVGGKYHPTIVDSINSETWARTVWDNPSMPSYTQITFTRNNGGRLWVHFDQDMLNIRRYEIENER